MTQHASLPDINKLAIKLLKQRGSSLRAQSLKMGYNHNYLGTALKRKNLPIGLLVELSNALGINLVELYIPLLNSDLRPTGPERALLQQLAERNSELHQTREERDKYWKVIEGRGSH